MNFHILRTIISWNLADLLILYRYMPITKYSLYYSHSMLLHKYNRGIIGMIAGVQRACAYATDD